MDRIFIQDLALRCVIGVRPDERHEKQDVLLNITLWADLTEACRSDDLADTVDYSAVKRRVRELVETSRFLLIERLAQAVADVCLEAPRVETVVVRVDKPGALRFTRSVAVEIERSKSGSRHSPRP